MPTKMILQSTNKINFSKPQTCLSLQRHERLWTPRQRIVKSSNRCRLGQRTRFERTPNFFTNSHNNIGHRYLICCEFVGVHIESSGKWNAFKVQSLQHRYDQVVQILLQSLNFASTELKKSRNLE